MAEIRTDREPRHARRTPVGWIIGLIVVAVATVAIIWWLRAGAPPAGVTGQEGVEERVEPGQPGLQPGTEPVGPPGAAPTTPTPPPD
jgi:hypothetical protein